MVGQETQTRRETRHIGEIGVCSYISSLTAQCHTHTVSRQTQATVTSMALHSSATLGTGKVMTNRQRLDRAEDLNVRCAMDRRIGDRRRRNTDYSGARPSDSDCEYDDPDSTHNNSPPNPTSIDTVSVVDSSPGSVSPEKKAQSVVGGALKRNSDGTLVAPRVVKKKERGKKVEVPCDLISSVTYNCFPRQPSRVGSTNRHNLQRQKQTRIHPLTVQIQTMTLIKKRASQITRKSPDLPVVPSQRMNRAREVHVRLRMGHPHSLALKHGQ